MKSEDEIPEEKHEVKDEKSGVIRNICTLNPMQSIVKRLFIF